MAGLGGLCLLCCLLLTIPAFAAEAADQPPDALPALRAEAPCATTALLPAEGVFAQARAVAWLRVMRQAAELLPRQREFGLGPAGLAALGGPAERAGLAACLYHLEDASYSHAGGKLAVQVRLAPHEHVRERLGLCLREAAFPALYGRLAAESGEVLLALQPLLDLAGRDMAADGQTGDGAEARRLWQRLEGLWLALMALELSPEGWQSRADALTSLERAARLAPHSPVVQLLLGEALLRQDLPLQSVEVCTVALGLESSLAHAHYVRALAHWRLQQLALAEADLDAALELANFAQGPAPAPPQEGQGVRRIGLSRCLRARGAVRLLRGNAGGMCADLRAACALGDCAALAEARRQGECAGTAGGEQP